MRGSTAVVAMLRVAAVLVAYVAVYASVATLAAVHLGKRGLVAVWIATLSVAIGVLSTYLVRSGAFERIRADTGVSFIAIGAPMLAVPTAAATVAIALALRETPRRGAPRIAMRAALWGSLVIPLGVAAGALVDALTAGGM